MLNKETIFEMVDKLLVQQLCIEPGTAKLEDEIRNDLGADSLDFVELILAVEENWGIEISDSAADKMVTVNDLVEHLCTELYPSASRAN